MQLIKKKKKDKCKSNYSDPGNLKPRADAVNKD